MKTRNEIIDLSDRPLSIHGTATDAVQWDDLPDITADLADDDETDPDCE